MENTTFVIATHNPNKVREFRRILEPMGISILTPSLTEAEETGTTFAENARIKADSACKETGLPSIADDSGLTVDALNGRPGVYSARYGGPQASDEDRVQMILQELKDVPDEQRGAAFVSAICCTFPNGDRLEVQGMCRGLISHAPAGEGGFGYDPIFLFGEKTFAQLSGEEKDAHSHRGEALRKFTVALQNYQNR
ncbi:MAG: RdgB/HAM1 family non-canonical purine NTP pyrophosphatase [Acutalibacteraceae bacterium]